MLSLLIIALRFLFLIALVIILFKLVKWMIADLYRISESPQQPMGEPAGLPAFDQNDEEQGQSALMVLESDIDTLVIGDSYPCVRGELLIGRSERNDVIVSGAYASARHARVFYRAGQYWLEDLHSTNGTYINGLKLDLPVVLANSDKIRIGNVTFQFMRWTNEMGSDH
ncbi:MAG: FHA domain-containing protein [Peptococcaceae bacterium]|nr:FHA domain-containing protein [Peptococcaceae bacterium]